MKFLFSILAAMLLSNTSYSQTNGAEITIKSNFFGTQYLQNGKRLNMSQLMKVMEPDEEAFRYIKSARTKNTISGIMSGVGGALIGWPVGTSMGGGEANWTLAAVGLGFVVVAVPISISAVNKTKTAVRLYNDGLKRKSQVKEKSMHIHLTGNTLALRWTF